MAPPYVLASVILLFRVSGTMFFGFGNFCVPTKIAIVYDIVRIAVRDQL